LENVDESIKIRQIRQYFPPSKICAIPAVYLAVSHFLWMYSYLLKNSYNPVVTIMDNGIEYDSNKVEIFAQSSTEEPQNLAFLTPAMVEYLKSVIPGKKSLTLDVVMEICLTRQLCVVSKVLMGLT